jgi:hypothetical protein
MTDSKYATRSSWITPEEQVVDLTLPSGNTVGIRDLTLLDAVAETITLEPLTGVAGSILNELMGESEIGVVGAIARVLGATPELYALTGPLCKAVFVSPKIVDDPQADDEIPLALLSKADRMFVLTHFLSRAEWLTAFFRQSGDGDPTGSDEPALRENAE